MRGTRPDPLAGRVVSFGCHRRPNRDDDTAKMTLLAPTQVNAAPGSNDSGAASRPKDGHPRGHRVLPRTRNVLAEGLGQRVSFGRHRSWMNEAPGFDLSRDWSLRNFVLQSVRRMVLSLTGFLARGIGSTKRPLQRGRKLTRPFLLSIGRAILGVRRPCIPVGIRCTPPAEIDSRQVNPVEWRAAHSKGSSGMMSESEAPQRELASCGRNRRALPRCVLNRTCVLV